LEKSSPPADRADHRQEHVADQGIDDPAERHADDHADGEIDHVPLHREFAELLQHRAPPRHSGSERSEEPGIHDRRPWIWIPDSPLRGASE